MKCAARALAFSIAAAWPLTTGSVVWAQEKAAAALETLPVKERLTYFAEAVAAGRTGSARKTKPVDARPAVVGEVVVTSIAGEGVETRSKPAKEGDWVVRNRCPETGNEEFLVSAAKFPTRYGDPMSEPDAKGYREFHPKGSEMHYFIVTAEEGEFAMQAPWEEMQRFRPGDAVVQTPTDPNDTPHPGSVVCLYL
jgi:hypothetical protein